MSPYSITRENAAEDAKMLRLTIAACQEADLTTPATLRELADSIEAELPKPESVEATVNVFWDEAKRAGFETADGRALVLTRTFLDELVDQLADLLVDAGDTAEPTTRTEWGVKFDAPGNGYPGEERIEAFESEDAAVECVEGRTRAVIVSRQVTEWVEAGA